MNWLQEIRTSLHEYRHILIFSGIMAALAIGMYLLLPSKISIDAAAGSITLEPLVTATASPTFEPTLTPSLTPSPTLEPTLTPSLTPSPTPSPTSTETPTPTVTPMPAFVVWAKEGTGGYLREAPANGRILETIQNGAVVSFLGETNMVGEEAWMHVLVYFAGAQGPASATSGWMSQLLLYPLPDGELAQVQSDDGVYLRVSPEARILDWLGNGTVVVYIATSDDGWVQVQTLDGVEGWLFEEFLITYSE